MSVQEFNPKPDKGRAKNMAQKGKIVFNERAVLYDIQKFAQEIAGDVILTAKNGYFAISNSVGTVILNATKQDKALQFS